jgi:DNA-binding MarR family transcriptional regulator
MNKIQKNSDNGIMLKILDEINRESDITQRTLASRLNIALGLVNAYIKRLAKKGHIKITKGPMNRVKYAITPDGFTHRLRLTYEYMNTSIYYFKEVREQIDSAYRKIIASGAKSILIWGDGEIAELSYISLRGLPLDLIGVIDSQAQEKDFFGHRIYSEEAVKKLKYDAILIASFNKKDMKKMKEMGIDRDKIYSL